MSTNDETEKLFHAGLSFVENSKNVTLSTSTKLTFYGLYCAAVKGKLPATQKAPSKINMVAWSKYNAWKTASEQIFGAGEATADKMADAKQKYIAALNKAVPGWDKQQAKL